jgi:hypothetical protein
MVRLMMVGIGGFAAGLTMLVDSLLPGPLQIADGWFAVEFVVLVVTWGAMVLAMRRRREDDGSRVSVTSLFRALPHWATVAIAVLGVLAALNFVALLATVDGSPSQTAVGYALMSHGDVVRTISEADYHRLRGVERRALLGPALIGYAVIAAATFAARRKYRVEPD